MGKRLYAETVTKGIVLPLELASQFELLEHDPTTQRVKYGAWSELMRRAITEYIELRQAGAPANLARLSKLDLYKRLQEAEKILAAVREGASL